MSLIIGTTAQTCNSMIYNEASGGVLTSWDHKSLLNSAAYDFATQSTSLSVGIKPVGQDINIIINLATQGSTVA